MINLIMSLTVSLTRNNLPLIQNKNRISDVVKFWLSKQKCFLFQIALSDVARNGLKMVVGNVTFPDIDKNKLNQFEWTRHPWMEASNGTYGIIVKLPLTR